MREWIHRVCKHRSVDGNGRITCNKIVEGDNEVSPNLCRTCPAKQIGCDKLRFSLEKSAPSPIVVRYGNGHTEVWNDEPPKISFLRAACAATVAPISDPRQCAACALRSVGEPILEEVALPQKVATGGKVISFPQRVAAAAS